MGFHGPRRGRQGCARGNWGVSAAGWVDALDSILMLMLILVFCLVLPQTEVGGGDGVGR